MQLVTAEKLGMLLGLSFFFGLSFEGFYWNAARSRPGGIRTFPLISLSGAICYALEPQFATVFCVGLIVLGVWLYPYYRAEVAGEQAADRDADGIMVPLCNIVAYLLGPVALTQEPWLAFALTVAAVLLLRARDRLHTLAESISGQEIIALAQFLVLTGVVLPLLPNKPVTSLTPITPFQVWLTVVVVSSLSYGSYLLQKLLSAQGSMFFTSVLGGLYSSTATTVVLARRLKEEPRNRHELQSGVVLATALMYLRLGVVVAIFNVPLALALAGPLVTLALAGGALAALCLWLGKRAEQGAPATAPEAKNPLELTAALIFAVLFVVISISSSWVKAHFGHVGIYWLAALVGVADIDPFVLSVAQGGVAGLDKHATAIAILVAASSNNALKAGYSVVFAGWRRSLSIVLSLVALGSLGLGIALWWAYGAQTVLPPT
ncbi:MAG: DUF4010 domain-containing protein [Planctomycetaceae bacterium]|nr:DUF4010 domain-containing protein [Planctomycetaceae bacterium]